MQPTHSNPSAGPPLLRGAATASAPPPPTNPEDLLPKAEHLDGKLVLLLLLPAAALAGAFYVSGAKDLAIGLAAVALLVALFASPEVGFYLYCALQPFDQAFIQDQDAFLTPSKVLAPLILLSYYCRAQRIRQPMLVSRPFYWAMMLYGVYGLLSAALSIAPLAALRYGAQIIVQVLMIAAVLQRLTDRTFILRALLFTIAGSLVSGLLVSVGIGGSTRVGGRATLGEFANPNTVALSICLGLICIPAAWGYTRNWFVRLLLTAAVPPMLFGMLKTGSRTGMLAAFGSIIVGMLLANGSGFIKRFLIPGAFLIVAGATAFVVMKARVLEDTSQQRFEALLEGDTGGDESRQFIWSTALSVWAEEPWGFGYGNTSFAMSQRRGYFVDIHSSYLAALVEGGPVGLVLFMLGLLLLFRAVWNINQPNPGLGAAILLGFVLIECAFHTLQYTKWFWIPITLCLLLAEQTQRERNALAAYAQRLRPPRRAIHAPHRWRPQPVVPLPAR